MNKNLALCVALPAAVFSLAACGADVKHGEITSKEDVPAQTNVYFQPVYSQRCTTRVSYVRTSTGGSRPVTSRSCTSYVSGHVPVYSHQDECFQLNLKNSSGDTGSVCVTKEQFDSTATAVGKQW